MGTRSVVYFVDGHQDVVGAVYRQWDGYPSGMGEDLKKIIGKRRIVNGISSGDTDVYAANGVDCLGATVIAGLKTDIGNVYLFPYCSTDSVNICLQKADAADAEFVYFIEPGNIVIGENRKKVNMRIYDVNEGTFVYDGDVFDFDASKLEDDVDEEDI